MQGFLARKPPSPRLNHSQSVWLMFLACIRFDGDAQISCGWPSPLTRAPSGKYQWHGLRHFELATGQDFRRDERQGTVSSATSDPRWRSSNHARISSLSSAVAVRLRMRHTQTTITRQPMDSSRLTFLRSRRLLASIFGVDHSVFVCGILKPEHP
jgi:hypothetical protein